MLDAFWVFFFLLTPAFILWLVRKYKFFSLIGDIVICYIIGIFLGNTGIIPLSDNIANSLSEATVPLAIILMLFSTDLSQSFKLSVKTFFAFLLGLVAVFIVTIATSFLFKDKIEEVWNLGGMAIGVYSGGTPNMSAIGLGLGVSPEYFALVNIADVIIGGTYLLFMMTVAKRIFGKLLNHYKNDEKLIDEEILNKELTESKLNVLNIIKSLVLAIVVFAVSLGVSMLIFNELKAGWIIFMITLFSVLLSFIKPIQNLKEGFKVGEYLLLIFALAIGSLADFSKVNAEAFNIVSFFGILILGTISLHLLLSKIFKVDADTFIITSIAAIMSPAFVPPVAKAINNNKLILPGITSGLVGFAVGNFLGLLMAEILQKFLS
jgi:uncharacterized membrane protein